MDTKKVSQQRGRSPSRAAVVCLGLLCVLLLAGITGLGLHYQGFRGQCHAEVRDQQLRYSNLTADRDQLERERDRLENIYNTLTAERERLETSYNTLTAERDQLETSYNTLTADRDQLETRYNNLTAERDQLETSYNTLTAERDQLKTSYNSLTLERDQLENNNNTLIAERDQLKQKSDQLTERIRVLESPCPLGWWRFSSSCYHISTEAKSWAESRQDCKSKGADLVVIDSREEQAFLHIFGKRVWIGLTDSEKEGTWTWLDGKLINPSKFWADGEPNDSHQKGEDCAEFRFPPTKPLMSWNDLPCSLKFHAVCEI
ncbi:C-type lectin domain family 4 member M-like isoform X2 [Hypomesus transpacificus]|uniref:C-type lectin domain family 4 member M-like isoform X2 n=1 Tax=Hypomesus transpacificus TaxID=137520 RepID=UPI001F082932|nr:C-type lectin domain family 4 member M-like isoform X2 [Hypomesus transpacificus]